MPLPELPVPTDAKVVSQSAPVTLSGDGSAPLFLRFDLAPGIFGAGSNVTFTVVGTSASNLGIYGPNPDIIAGVTGRMRAPKIGHPDSNNLSCQGNFHPGTYYLVLRSGSSGNVGPQGTFSFSIKVQPWKIFGAVTETAEPDDESPVE